MIIYSGMWRSSVAHTAGGRGVASSNLVIPTIFFALAKVIPGWYYSIEEPPKTERAYII